VKSRSHRVTIPRDRIKSRSHRVTIPRDRMKSRSHRVAIPRDRMKSRSDRVHLAPPDTHTLTDRAARERDDLAAGSNDLAAPVPHVNSNKPRLTSFAPNFAGPEDWPPSA
jgi:hypothetical protein